MDLCYQTAPSEAQKETSTRAPIWPPTNACLPVLPIQHKPNGTPPGGLPEGLRCQ